MRFYFMWNVTNIRKHWKCLIKTKQQELVIFVVTKITRITLLKLGKSIKKDNVTIFAISTNYINELFSKLFF